MKYRRGQSRLSTRLAHIRSRRDHRPTAHFIHIGKTAGTALKFALREVQGSAKYKVLLHSHNTRLPDIPEEDWFFFCVRDPIDRFVSGFLSRQRRSHPCGTMPWDPSEAAAFERFASPEELAGSLSVGGLEQRQAEEAMRSIQHVRSFYWDWFRDGDYFKSRVDHLLWIGRMESLDLASLAERLGVGLLRPPEDPVLAHITVTPKPALSVAAEDNLRRWYAKDFEFLALCDELLHS